MAIRLPTIKARPSDTADWIELRTLADPGGFFRPSLLKRYWDTLRETEESDPEGEFGREENTDEEGVSGGDEDVYLDSVMDELADRADSLKDTYPFSLENEGARFQVKSDLDEAHYVYLFCLIISHFKADDVLDGTWIPPIDNKVRDLFQACSTLAAAGIVTGSAVSFGWPRPINNPPFLRKLKETYARFGEGQTVDVAPAGASPAPKDEEIDIIAWQPRPDRTPGTQYLLGQVASGANWQGKSILGGPIARFHRTWFVRAPASPPIASMFVPRVANPVGAGTRREFIDLETVNFGMIYDRFSIPLYVQRGIDVAESGRADVYVERRDEMPEIGAWVAAQIESLRLSGRVPL